MAQKAIQGNNHLAKKIKERRNELGLTIEEAALRAGVGTKTWSRYESGESIRQDKCKGVCRALNWRTFPEDDANSQQKHFLDEYKSHEAWSHYLEDNYGLRAAMSFVIGSDMLLDFIEQDLADLASMPAGSHIGQLDTSFIKEALPPQFLMEYDYPFLYQMKCTLIQLRARARCGSPMAAHSVMEELLIYLCNEEAKAFIELSDSDFSFDTEENLYCSDDWIFDLFDDDDLLLFLYSNQYLDKDHPYAFSHWNDQQFYSSIASTEGSTQDLIENTQEKTT